MKKIFNPRWTGEERDASASEADVLQEILDEDSSDSAPSLANEDTNALLSSLLEDGSDSDGEDPADATQAQAVTDLPVQTSENITTQTSEDITTQTPEDITTQTPEDITTHTSEDHTTQASPPRPISGADEPSVSQDGIVERLQRSVVRYEDGVEVADETLGEEPLEAFPTDSSDAYVPFGGDAFDEADGDEEGARQSRDRSESWPPASLLASASDFSFLMDGIYEQAASGLNRWTGSTPFAVSPNMEAQTGEGEAQTGETGEGEERSSVETDLPPGYEPFDASPEVTHTDRRQNDLFMGAMPLSEVDLTHSFAFKIRLLDPHGAHSRDRNLYTVVTVTDMPEYANRSDVERTKSLNVDTSLPPPAPIPPQSACQEMYPYTILPSPPPLPSPTVVLVERKFPELKWLHKALHLSHPGAVIPPFPERGVLDGFAPPDTKLRVLQVLEMEDWLQRIASHPVLCRSPFLLAILTQTSDKLKATVARFSKSAQARAAELSLSRVIRIGKHKSRDTPAEMTAPESREALERIIECEAGTEAVSKTAAVLLAKYQCMAINGKMLGEVFGELGTASDFAVCVADEFRYVSRAYGMCAKLYADHHTQTEPSLLLTRIAHIAPLKRAMGESLTRVKETALDYDIAVRDLNSVLDAETKLPATAATEKRRSSLLSNLKDREKSVLMNKMLLDKMLALSRFDVSFFAQHNATEMRYAIIRYAKHQHLLASKVAETWDALEQDMSSGLGHTPSFDANPQWNVSTADISAVAGSRGLEQQGDGGWPEVTESGDASISPNAQVIKTKHKPKHRKGSRRVVEQIPFTE